MLAVVFVGLGVLPEMIRLGVCIVRRAFSMYPVM